MKIRFDGFEKMVKLNYKRWKMMEGKHCGWETLARPATREARNEAEIAIVAEESVESRTLVFLLYNAIRGWLNPIHPESKGRYD